MPQQTLNRHHSLITIAVSLKTRIEHLFATNNFWLLAGHSQVKSSQKFFIIVGFGITDIRVTGAPWTQYPQVENK